jgi:hypothetical protein
MRESQMKKIIAVAVAGAFVAPAYAADVTISGSVEYIYKDVGGVTTATHDGFDPLFSIGATSQTDAGYTVSANIDVDTGSTNTLDNSKISIAGDFGSLSLGAPSGGLDAAGDYTDIAPEKGGFHLDGNDHFMLLQPNLGIAGMSVALSINPATTNSAGGSAGEGHGASITYDAGGFTMYAGREKIKGNDTNANDSTETTTAYGVKTTLGGLYIAAEKGTRKNSGVDVTEVSVTGLAAKYSLDKITIGVEQQSSDQGYDHLSSDTDSDDKSTKAKFDETTAFVSYNFGGGLSAYLEQYDESVAGTEQTTIGVKYSF